MGSSILPVVLPSPQDNGINAMEKFRVLIAPCSDNEDVFYNASNFEEAVEISKINGDGVSIHEFDTDAERKAFILGYQAGIGWMGDGVFFES